MTVADKQINGIDARASQVGMARLPAHDNPSSPRGDVFVPGPGVFKSVTREFVDALLDETNRLQVESAMASSILPEAEITAHSVVVKSRVMPAAAVHCCLKIPLDDGSGNILVIPFYNWAGQDYGKPVAYNDRQGVIGAVNHIPLRESAQGLSAARSPQGERIYIYNTNSSKVNVYDKTLKSLAEIDFTAINPDAQKMKFFRSGKQADYAFLGPEKLGSNKGCFFALDKDTHKVLWSHVCDTIFSRGAFEAPDGSVCLSLGTWERDKPKLLRFNSRGEKEQEISLPSGPNDMVYRDDGAMIVSVGGKIKKRALSALRPASGKEEKFESLAQWSISEKELENLQLSPDQKSLYAVDPKPGFHRSHSIVKINAHTGQAEWKRERYGELLINYRVIGDDIYILSSGEEKKKILMTRLNAKGEEIWQDIIPGEIDEYDEGKENTINERGEFLFACADGKLYHVSPKKGDETAESILSRIQESRFGTRKSALMEQMEREKEQGAPSPKVQETEDFVDIDGIKLEKRFHLLM
jgi:outer membrane protein assembly factor BamB